MKHSSAVDEITAIKIAKDLVRSDVVRETVDIESCDARSRQDGSWVIYFDFYETNLDPSFIVVLVDPAGNPRFDPID